MAEKQWIGGADAVAQVHTASIDTVDGTPANNTFTVTIGDLAISQAGDTDVATTAAALVALLNASAHPYFAAITWTNPSAGNIVGTADTAGVPFVAALTETGAGSATVTDFAETTASAGPADAGTAANWSGAAVPGAADNVVFKDSSASCVYNLDAISAAVAAVEVHKTYTGLLGLARTAFATSADGATETSGVNEYRERYFRLSFDSVEIGIHNGPGRPTGSARVKIRNTKAGSSTFTIHDTHSNGQNQRPAVQLLAAHASADVFINGCPGAVALGGDAPSDTATFGDVYVAADSGDQVFIDRGVTYTNLEAKSGQILANGAATVTKIENNGADITIEGAMLVTTIENNSGTTTPNNVGAGASAVTTVNANGGLVDGTQSQAARTWDTVNIDAGGAVARDSAHVTITTFALPTGPATIQAA